MTSDLKSATPITKQYMCILFIWYEPFWQSPRPLLQPNSLRSNLTSDLKSVSPITYISMCILLIWQGPFWWPQRPLQPPNGLKAKILPQIWNLWPKLHMQPCLLWLFRPPYIRCEKKKKKIKKETETDNYYTCVALRAAGKNKTNLINMPKSISNAFRVSSIY